MTPELHQNRLRQLTWIKARLVLPPLACLIGVVGALVVAELQLVPPWMAYVVAGGMVIAMMVNHVIAANARCPNCREKFFWSGAVWSIFRHRCPHCGLGPPSPDPIAVASGYLGLLSVLIVPAPIALATSLICLRRARANPDFVGRSRAWFGIVMGIPGTILIVLLIAAGLRN